MDFKLKTSGREGMEEEDEGGGKRRLVLDPKFCGGYVEGIGVRLILHLTVS